MTAKITIKILGQKTGTAEREQLETLLSKLDFSKDIRYFLRCIEEADEARVVVIATLNETPVGLCVVNFVPIYPMFRRLHIPEIQDLNVMSDARHQGVGAALVAAAEELARGRGHTQMGIGVGLTSAYGAAQRLYMKLGYLPDGAGISYDGAPVRAGEMRAVDDELCLYLVREI